LYAEAVRLKKKGKEAERERERESRGKPPGSFTGSHLMTSIMLLFPHSLFDRTFKRRESIRKPVAFSPVSLLVVLLQVIQKESMGIGNGGGGY